MMMMMMMKNYGVEAENFDRIRKARGRRNDAPITVSQGRKDLFEQITRRDMVDKEGARASDDSNHQKDIGTQMVDCICFVVSFEGLPIIYIRFC